jgi:hypothetical protein
MEEEDIRTLEEEKVDLSGESYLLTELEKEMDDQTILPAKHEGDQAIKRSSPKHK